jgi:glutamine synthetase adenylyltransferase
LLKPVRADRLEIKYNPGGLLDIEFVAQTAILAARIPCAESSTLGMMDLLAAQQTAWKTAAPQLLGFYLRLREFEQLLQLSSARAISEVERAHPAFVKAASLMGMAADVAWMEIHQVLESSRAVLNGLDPTGLKI